MSKLIEQQKNFMNTVITFKIVQTDESTVEIQNAIEEGFGEFDRIVKQYTRFNDNSELSNLNRMNGKWVQVSDEFFWLIKEMLFYSKFSDGAFDPTVIDFLEIYGYDKNYDFSKLENPNLDDIVKKRVKSRPSWKEIEIDEKDKKVKLAKTQRIDLGGIGKGYAIDCAFEKLLKVCKNFLIDAGGDIRVQGLNQDEANWRVSLKTFDKIRQKEETMGEVVLESGFAIASSGSWARKFKQFHHLINPVSGKPMEKDYSTVFVKSENATKSDALATALFIAGENFLKKLDKENISYFFG